MSNDNRSRSPLQPADRSRRRFLTQAGTAVAGLAASLATPGAEAQHPATHSQTARHSRPNILFLMSDDMCAELSCYGALARAQTPNLDRLAAEGVRFDRNYCQFPLCNPSRASLFTGRKPTVTGVLGNRTDFRAEHPEWVSLPQFFREHGYSTYRTGKIFHGGIDDPKAWDVVGFDENKIAGTELPLEHQRVIPPQSVPPPPPGIPIAKPIPAGSPDPNHSAHSDRILIVEGDGTGHPENQNANRAIAYLREHRDAGSAKSRSLSFSPAASPNRTVHRQRHRASMISTISARSICRRISPHGPLSRQVFPVPPFASRMLTSSLAAEPATSKPKRSFARISPPPPGPTGTSVVFSKNSTKPD